LRFEQHFFNLGVKTDTHKILYICVSLVSLQIFINETQLYMDCLHLMQKDYHETTISINPAVLFFFRL